MDALSDILNTIKLKSAIYFRKNFYSPWGMDIEKGEFAQFHLVVKGNCIINSNEFDKPKQLSAGDIIVFINGCKHWIADSASSTRVSGEQILLEHKQNKLEPDLSECDTTLICGHFEFNKTFHHPFLLSLPPYIILSNSDKRELNWLEILIQVIEQETDSGKSGSDIVVKRLGEILFIQILRVYIAKLKVSEGFLAALGDNHLNKALSLIHSNPAQNWTLENIARTIGMSRAAFALKFRKILGTTPIKYLTNWRMIKAKEYLSNPKTSISEVAENVGYFSESSFIRAFRKQFAQNPGQFRRTLIQRNIR